MSKSSVKSSIETIWGTTVGMIALMVIFLPAEFKFIGAALAIVGAASSTIVISKQQERKQLAELELKKELDELKHAIAELQIHTADDSLKKQIDELSKRAELP